VPADCKADIHVDANALAIVPTDVHVWTSDDSNPLRVLPRVTRRSQRDADAEALTFLEMPSVADLECTQQVWPH